MANDVTLTIKVDEYPQLKLLAWHMRGLTEIAGAEAFNLYERNWRYVDTTQITPQEQSLITELTQRYGHGYFLV